ncbi:MAG: tetraacyldisaccharide 4'-kinase [Proteobacteria bacterium]|nr:tetraacyldisaccharide 4'-kinase [Pseudomonadota bacterium]
MAFIDFNLQLSSGTFFKWLFLRLISSFYSFLVQCRLLLYRLGFVKIYTSKVPVVSVGNITVGGTGKTPITDWLLSFYERQDIKTAVLTRGYKAKKETPLQILNAGVAEKGNCQTYGDEPWMLFRRHPETTIYVGSNRVNSAQLAEKEADLLLLDDGMQHLRLDRQLNLVLIDCQAGIGNGHLIPLGPLREPLHSLSRSDAIIYTRTEAATSSTVQKKLAAYLDPELPTFNARFLPHQLISSLDGTEKTLEELKGKQAVLFSGIGNPEAFTKTMEQIGCSVADHLALTDHVSYTSAVMEKLKQRLWNYSTDLVICTEKDWVKLEPVKEQLPEFWYLKLKVEMDEKFKEFLVCHLNKFSQGTEIKI